MQRPANQTEEDIDDSEDEMLEDQAESVSHVTPTKPEHDSSVIICSNPDPPLEDEEFKSQSRERPEASPQILALREKYSEIVMAEFEDEDFWACDVCLSRENEEDDPLTQCELCQVVVHPACYRRDLYENEDMPDNEPWYCAKCKFVMQADKEGSKAPLPNCLLCPDVKGAMVDLTTKEWVHHTCVNWHNEIWFEQNDTK